MTILQEILEWSQGRPAWQRDALRRLVLNGELSSNDIVCKSAHGLAEQQETAPLATEHVPGTAELKADIEALENWVAAIRKRRKKPVEVASI